ncbi:phage recombination protein Bet [Roseibium algae]|uniref:Phage recombination protein Bet n=1 Tax=Roseibium algae TaxID=3123038 RepID=A0ABU8TQJ3_9HYPH
MSALPELRPNQIELVRSTIAKDCDNGEFNLFMEAAKSYGLDPFRKQILPLVFSKTDPKKRRMSIVVSRDGLRVIAQRCGNYRPASEPAQFVYDKDLISDTNPKGIASVSVRLWQQDNRGEWFPVMGEADWDEFAPLKEIWTKNEETGRDHPSGKFKLDATGQWARMPKVMLTKCAEAQALRAGWPDQFGGVYVEEEMHQAQAQDLTASQIIEHEQEQRRLARVSSVDAVMMSWSSDTPLEPVPVGQLADRIIEWSRDKSRTLEQLETFTQINLHSLREFWAKSPNDGLEVKKEIERRIDRLTTRAIAA